QVKSVPIWLNSLNPSLKKISDNNSNCLPTDLATESGSIKIKPNNSVINSKVKTISIEKNGFLKLCVKLPSCM
ncbi:MAG: hypothetical protein HF967_05470, partial [Methanosarcinales archaeon]|nr:hypothetical protein [Methanosarcinales archaeon]